MKTPQRVLELLYDRDGSFALDELAAAAGLDRQRLGRALKTLERDAQRLEFSPTGEVRLLRPVAMEANLIERGLGTARIGRSVICFREVDSTNDVAFDSARQAGADGLVVLAESQRRGRGRLGRRWVSPSGANILMSVLRIASAKELPHEAVTIAAGLAVALGVEDCCGLTGQLKWPNDVLLAGRKLAGVLVEIRSVAAARAVVVGIGLNANASPGDEAVDVPATSLAEHLHHPVERVELVRAILRRLEEWTGIIAAGRLDALHGAWLSRCGMLNERLAVQCGSQRYVGRVLDVSPLEGLVLSCDDGRLVHLAAEGSTVIHK